MITTVHGWRCVMIWCKFVYTVCTSIEMHFKGQVQVPMYCRRCRLQDKKKWQTQFGLGLGLKSWTSNYLQTTQCNSCCQRRQYKQPLLSTGNETWPQVWGLRKVEESANTRRPLTKGGKEKTQCRHHCQSRCLVPVLLIRNARRKERNFTCFNLSHFEFCSWGWFVDSDGSGRWLEMFSFCGNCFRCK